MLAAPPASFSLLMTSLSRGGCLAVQNVTRIQGGKDGDIQLDDRNWPGTRKPQGVLTLHQGSRLKARNERLRGNRCVLSLER